MKLIIHITLLVLIVSASAFAQQNTAEAKPKLYPNRILMIEPGIGIHTNFGTDFLITNLVQWNPRGNLSLAAHTSFNINNITQREFNHIRTNYNYSFNQKIGAGLTVYREKSAHTFLAMIGFKYTAFRETLENPNLDKVSTTISAVSPDYGIMYSLKKGFKKYFFSYRMYVPLYPWPVKGSDINYTDGNLNNISLEVALGIKLK